MNTETVTETVTADQLSVGDRVLAFGLEVKVAFIGNVSLELEANGKRIANGLWVPLEGSTFERIIPPWSTESRKKASDFAGNHKAMLRSRSTISRTAKRVTWPTSLLL